MTSFVIKKIFMIVSIAAPVIVICSFVWYLTLFGYSNSLAFSYLGLLLFTAYLSRYMRRRARGREAYVGEVFVDAGDPDETPELVDKLVLIGALILLFISCFFWMFRA